MKRLGILLGLLLTGCSTGLDITSYFHKDNVHISDLENNQNMTTVSMILPLSGTWATTGESFQKASLLALDEHPNTPIRILYFDTQSTSEGPGCMPVSSPLQGRVYVCPQEYGSFRLWISL